MCTIKDLQRTLRTDLRDVNVFICVLYLKCISNKDRLLGIHLGCMVIHITYVNIVKSPRKHYVQY